ncbi:MAG: UDP-N-acetylmuramate dehydrogenase [Spirochaetota bacterium]
MNSNLLSTSLLQKCKEKLYNHQIPFREKLILSSFCPFTIGGESPLIIEPQNNEHLYETLVLLKTEALPYKILGGGSNLLISDHPDDFITLFLGGQFKEYQQEEDSGFYIGSSCNTTPTFRKIALQGYTGGEFLSTIPGKIGGAVVQNAGCYGGELFDFIEYVDVFLDTTWQRIHKDKIKFGYRYTEFLENKNCIITGIKIKFSPGNLADIQESLKEKRERRNSSQPANKRSAGSIFKNPKGQDNDGTPLKSWKLIDRVGLRGQSKGDALLSPEHCNFIVNTGQAKAVDVDYLIRLAREKVEKQSGIVLEQEVEYFGTIP